MKFFSSGGLSWLAVSAALVNAATYDTRFDNVTWDDSAWTITTTALNPGIYEARMSLANGYLGINVAAIGPFFEFDVPVNGDDINGWPLFDRRQTFATIGGFYDEQPETNGTNFLWLNQYGGESVISGVPHWGGLVVQVGNLTLDAVTDPSQISNFVTSFNFMQGVMYWNYTWTPAANMAMNISYTMFVHKLLVNQAAVQLEITADQDMNVTVSDVLDGDCALRTNFVGSGSEGNSTIWTAVSPHNVGNVSAYIYSTMTGSSGVDLSKRMTFNDSKVTGPNANQSWIGQTVPVSLKANQMETIAKFIGGASTDAFSDPQSTARNASSSGASTGFMSGMQASVNEWMSIMTPDSVDNYSYPNGSLPDDPHIVELQITAVTNMYHLLQNTVGTNAIAAAGNNSMLDVNSISVCGLGSECYAGLIFWDAEVWMAPGLVVTHPAAAKQIAQYRVEKYGQAQANVKTAFTSSQNMTNFTDSIITPAVFPWTSGRYGNCTGTGPCFDYEYHINGDIGLEHYNYFVASGDMDYWQNTLFPIYDSVASFYAQLVKQNGSQYVLTNATDPDEYANNVDNPGYTMVLIKTHLETALRFRQQFSQSQPQLYENVSMNIDVPTYPPADIILEYPGMNGSILVKQADVVLIDDFLVYPNNETLSDLDFYAGRQSQDGPGMTYGVFSIVANANAPSGCEAYTYHLYSSEPYVRAPWYQFSEQLEDDFTTNGGTHPAFPFLTGIGGANRVAVFGYLGLHLTDQSFNINPNLPPQIPYLDYRTIYWQGWPINATSNQTHTTLTRMNNPLPNANSTYSSTPIPVTINITQTLIGHLGMGDTMTVENRQIANVQTEKGNIAQCAAAYTSTTYQKGQFPAAAIDGASATKWQPTFANTSSILVVDLQNVPYTPVSELRFDWAGAPPTSYSVQFTNSSYFNDTQLVMVSNSSNITISNAYDASTLANIVQYVGNTTNVSLSTPVYSGNFALLTIQGNQADPASNATGATVAEFNIIAAGS